EKIIGDIQEFVTGIRQEVIDDRVLATILFVDIADSTKMLSELGDRVWKEKLESYYRLVRSEFGHYRGRETNTAGDGIMASFDGPARAVRCASAIASQVKQLGLDGRAGVHTGEVQLMGDNIVGIAVHIASRVQSESAPGEVIVSSTTKDLIAGSGISFQPRDPSAGVWHYEYAVYKRTESQRSSRHMAPLHRRKSVTSLSRRCVKSLNYKLGRARRLLASPGALEHEYRLNWPNDN